ncbi:MAG: phage antirepressor [Eubacterium sp.]
MNNELKVINEQEVLGKQFKIYGTVDEPLFMAKDVAEWIDYSQSNTSHMIATIDEDEKVRKNITTPGGAQEAWFLTEDGLYEVLMQSRKPIAKQFKKKVKEILKSIRKNGGYISGQENLSDDELMAKALLVAQNKIAERDKMIAEKDTRIAQMKPKEIFADAVATSHTSILVGDLAKLIKQNGKEIGQNRLFAWMRENGYLIKKKGSNWNMPTQRSMEMELFEVKESTINNPDGSVRINKTTKVTGKGQQYFINKFVGVA